MQATLEGPASSGSAVAGTTLRVALKVRDRFGNETTSRSEQVAVVAVGPSLVTFGEVQGGAFQCALLASLAFSVPLLTLVRSLQGWRCCIKDSKRTPQKGICKFECMSLPAFELVAWTSKCANQQRACHVSGHACWTLSQGDLWPGRPVLHQSIHQRATSGVGGRQGSLRYWRPSPTRCGRPILCTALLALRRLSPGGGHIIEILLHLVDASTDPALYPNGRLPTLQHSLLLSPKP